MYLYEIFRNAHFGDTFLRRDGNIAVFIRFNPYADEVELIHNVRCVYGSQTVSAVDGRYYSGEKFSDADIVTPLHSSKVI